MSKAKTALLTLATALLMSAVAAAGAQAIEFKWHVGGKSLEKATETRELETKAKKAKKAFVLKGEVLEAKVEIECTEVALAAGAKIIGGTPGTDEETVEFKGCKFTKPVECEVENKTITTNKLKSEIVEGVGASKGKVLTLFTPPEGKPFVEIKIVGEKCAIKGKQPVQGSVLAEDKPQKEEAVVGTVKFEPEEPKKYKNSKGEEKAAGLTFAKNTATLSGEQEVELKGKEKFGAF
jgi:hypothetical protein